MSGTQPRELLTCLCGAFFAVDNEVGKTKKLINFKLFLFYFINNTSKDKINIQTVVDNFLNIQNIFIKNTKKIINISELKPYIVDEPNYIKTKLDPLTIKKELDRSIYSINSIKIFKEDEILSAFNTIYLLKQKLNLNFKKYKFYHQESEFVKVVKENAPRKIAKILQDTDFKSDRYTPADIYMVDKSQENSSLEEYNNHIINASIETIIKNMSLRDTGVNTYRTITNKLLKDRIVIPISLKKQSGTLKLSFVGTQELGLNKSNVEKLKRKDIDHFTRFMGHLLTLDYNKVEKQIDQVINIKNVDIGINKAHYIVKADFLYNTIEILKDINNIPIILEIRKDNSFNTKERGKNYGGGMTFKVTFDYLIKNNQIQAKIKSFKSKINHIIYMFCLSKNKQNLTSKIQNIFQKTNILYLKKDLLEIETTFDNYQMYIEFLEFMIKSLSKDKNFLGNSKKQVILEETLSKIQVATFFMDSYVKKELKKLIFFFVYGLTTKKMHGILEKDPNKDLVKLVQAYQVEYEKIDRQTKQKTKMYVGYTTAPYILIS